MSFIDTCRHLIFACNHNQKYAIISINEEGKIIPITYQRSEDCIDFIQLCFTDTEEDVIVTDKIRYHTITDNQADLIVEFVENNKEKVDYFIVHCHAGISRSSGVAKALYEIYNNDKDTIDDDERFLPNKTVYEKVIHSYQRKEYLKRCWDHIDDEE